MESYLFVGERRSNRAMEMAVTWRDGRLAAKTLFEGLRAAGIDPQKQDYINIWDDANNVIDTSLVAIEACAHKPGGVVVGMGRRVCKYLTGQGVPHIRIVHPAARGTIRRAENYRAHLRSQLVPKVTSRRPGGEEGEAKWLYMK
jgi:hypothetical protein